MVGNGKIMMVNEHVKTRGGNDVKILRSLKTENYIYGAYIAIDFDGEEKMFPVRWNKDGSYIDSDNPRSLDLVLG